MMNKDIAQKDKAMEQSSQGLSMDEQNI